MYQPAISSMSLGRAWHHELKGKIEEASKAGFRAIEIFYEDLEYLARSQSGEDGLVTPELLVAAADTVRNLCADNCLEIIVLQPFLFYEGLRDRVQHDRLIEKLHVWFDIADALDTDIIQIPSNFLPVADLIDDLNQIVADLVQVADLGAARVRPIRFAYENLCFGTYIDTWEQAWEVVCRVNRPNFGICLDTFNIAGRVYADPAAADGVAVNGEENLAASLERLVATVDVSKVFYLQVIDAERLEAPLDAKHEFYVEGQPSRMSWSRNARCFIYETDRGAYLPVEKVARAIVEGLGYEGYVSMELFSRTMADPDPTVPATHARRGIDAWKKFQTALCLA